jgi:predicted ferric reductase
MDRHEQLLARLGSCGKGSRVTLVEWYVARAGGIVAFALLTAAVVAGLTLSTRTTVKGWPRFAVEDVHRFLGLLTGSFVLIHVGALFVDAYIPFSLGQLVVPGTSSYRPLATALGVVGAELLLALALANRFRSRLTYRFWRRTHYLNFAVWLLAFFHGVFAGSDTGAAWTTSLYVASAGLVGGLVTFRLAKPAAPSVSARAS